MLIISFLSLGSHPSACSPNPVSFSVPPSTTKVSSSTFGPAIFPDLFSSRQMIPDLPVEIIGVIAGHLAGMFAFATLASLNVTNRNVRYETLPVLWETLLLDRYDPSGASIPHRVNCPPASNLRHVK
jgi:hypothetical protein